MDRRSGLLLCTAAGILAGFAAGATVGRSWILGGVGDSESRPAAETAAAPAPLPPSPRGDGAPPAATLSGAPAPDVGGAASKADTALVEEVERLRARVAALEAEKASVWGSAAPRVGPTFTFGAMGKLPAVREADWGEMAAASRAVADALVEIQTRADAGEKASKDVYIRLQENTERVRKYEYRTIDRMPTAAQHNGELTHPISLANLIAALLAQAGKPLEPRQVADLERLGLAFEEEFDRTRAGWTDSMHRARRILEEYRLKKRFADDVHAALSSEQQRLWADPAWRGVAGIDLFDATLMVIHTTTVVSGATAGEIRGSLAAILRGKAGLAAADAAPRLDAALDAFLDRTTRGLSPVPKARAKRYTSSEALAAGEASADLLDALLRDSEATSAAKKSLLDDPTWYLPRLVAP